MNCTGKKLCTPLKPKMSMSPSMCTFIVHSKNQETEDLLVAKKMLSMNCTGKKLCTPLKPKMSMSPSMCTFIVHAQTEYPK